MQILGIFETVFPDGDMTLVRALLISLVGFSVVFIILGILALFVKAMGTVFDLINSKKAALAAGEEVSLSNEKTGVPLPEGTSAGELQLIDVSQEEAAVIMALTSKKSGVPLNRLKFNYIKKLEDKKQ